MPKRHHSQLFALTSIRNSILASLFLVLSASTALPVDFYVSTTGDNGSSDGSFDNPWRTIQHALDQMQLGAGSTLYIRGGMYSEKLDFPKSGAPSQPITVRNYPGETVVLDGGSVPGAVDGPLVRIEGRSYIRLQNIRITNWKTMVQNEVPIGVLVTASANGLTGCQQVELIGLTIDGIWQTYDNGSNMNDGKDFGSDAHGILVSGNGETEEAAINNLLIEGCELHDLKLGTSEALVLNGNVKNFAIRSTSVHDCNNIGIDLIGFEGTSPVEALDQARNGYLADCVVYNISTQGNVGYRTGMSPDTYDLSSAGVYVDGGRDIVIERNRIYDNNIGCEVASENAGKSTENIIVRNNFIYRNEAFTGLSIGGMASSGAGFTKNCQIINNTFWGNDSINGFNGQIHLQWDVRDSRFQNNIIVAHPDTGVLIGDPSDGDNRPINLSFNYNLYYNPGDEPSTWNWKGSAKNYLEWKTETGGEMNSMNGTDPLFVNEAALDFHLQPTSLARNAGSTSNIDPGPLDVDGQTRVSDTMIDIGADEAQTSMTDVFGGEPIVGFPGWRASSWYMNFNVDFLPWIFHDEHGWQLVDSGSTEEVIFLWDLGLGEWLFLNENTYRWMFLFGDNSGWIFTFGDNTPDRRFFQRFDDGSLFSVPPDLSAN